MARIIEGFATTEDVDKVGDIVRADGVKFGAMPFPLLGGHDHKLPIGKVVRTQTIPGVGVLVRAEIIPAGQSRTADDWWAAVKHGAAVGLSIGFRPNAGKPNAVGTTYTDIMVNELSVVPVPCNSACQAKIIDDTPAAASATSMATPKVAPAKSAVTAVKKRLIAEEAARIEAKRKVIRSLGGKV